MLTTLAQNLKLLKPERERSREKNQRTGDWTLQITDKKELALYLDPWEESLLNFVMSQIYIWNSTNQFSRWRNITYIHIKNRQSLSTRSVWFPLFYGESWKTRSWFLLYIGSAQLIRRRVKIGQLWICFSFWCNIFNNSSTAVRIDICYSLSWCLYWESFIAFNFIYISNKTKGPPSVKWVILLWAPLVFQPPATPSW